MKLPRVGVDLTGGENLALLGSLNTGQLGPATSVAPQPHSEAGRITPD